MGCFGFINKKANKNQPLKPATPAKSPNSSSRVSPRKPSSTNNAVAGVQKSNSVPSSPLPLPPQSSLPKWYEDKQRLRVFELDELRKATNDFNRALKIGEGGFGSVYRGFFRPEDGKGERIVAAVKKLNQRSLQGQKEWLAELQFLGVLEHPNLVKLIGYCTVDDEIGKHRSLVYEFMPNRSLEDHLFNRAYPPLSWNTRLQVILGAAEGLVYLHEGLAVQVIYRDFKASNILLDADFKPKLSDFGLAREGPTGEKTHVSTAVVGTNGYAAPDYVATGHLTTKSDLWSFGVVLYELLTGRRSLERSRPPSEQKLLHWIRQFPPDSGNFRMIMDPRLQNKYPLQGAREIARLADRCLVKNAKDRPKMSEVVEVLRRVMQMDFQPSKGGRLVK